MFTDARRWSLAVLAMLAWPAASEVVEADEHGFISAHEVEIDAPPERVFEALVDEVGAWWDAAHSYTGDAANLSFDDFCGGLCEELDGQTGWVRHMSIEFIRDGKTLVLSGGLGPLQRLGVAGSMSFDFEATETGTMLRYRYVVSGRRVGSWAEPVDRVQGGQLQRLKRYVETGSPLSE